MPVEPLFTSEDALSVSNNPSASPNHTPKVRKGLMEPLPQMSHHLVTQPQALARETIVQCTLCQRPAAQLVQQRLCCEVEVDGRDRDFARADGGNIAIRRNLLVGKATR